MAVPYTPIMASLGYILSADGKQVLMVHRNARPDTDQAFGKYNGLGGKMEKDEDIVSCMKREILEESGLQVNEMRLRGTISWPGFGKKGEDWMAFIFLVTSFTGTPSAKNVEGTLHWVPLQRLLDACSPQEETQQQAQIPLWPGDMHFVPLVFAADQQQRSFHGVMPYSQGKPQRWSYTWV
jgi:8-oxo-dGTP diphosphatase